MHHSFVQLPDNNKTRAHDARSPYNTNSYFDYSTPVTEPIQKKLYYSASFTKRSTAAKSEAVKPIIYYLDNGTLNRYEVLLMEGASWWNQAKQPVL
jgi:hypothetical protein